MPHPLPFFLVGGVLVVVAIAILAMTIDFSLHGGDIDKIFPRMKKKVIHGAMTDAGSGPFRSA